MRPKVFSLFLSSLVFTTVLILPQSDIATREKVYDLELWQMINIHKIPIGHSVIRIKGDVVEENMLMTVRALGSAREVKTRLVWYKDRDMSFKRFVFELETEGSKNLIKGEVQGSKLYVQIGETKREIELKAGSKVYTGSSYIFILKDKIITSKHKRDAELFYFDPSVLKFDVLRIKYEGEERGYHRFSKIYGGISSTLIFSRDGEFIREEGPANIELVKSSYDEIISSPRTNVDIIFSTSSKAYGNIPNVDRKSVKYVKLMVEGVEDIKEFPPFQNVKKANGKIYIEIRKEPLYQGSVPRHYVLPEPLIESNSPEIIKLAKEILSKTGKKKRKPVEIAKAVSDWVYSNIEKTSVLSMPSAVEVLKTRKGDCNEHAVLSVALLRALGIPSRVAFGLVYDKGSFFYHAWVEFNDGEKWMSFDPTWNLFPSDIMRIKLGDGNVSEWVEVLRYVGRIKITFVEWKI